MLSDSWPVVWCGDMVSEHSPELVVIIRVHRYSYLYNVDILIGDGTARCLLPRWSRNQNERRTWMKRRQLWAQENVSVRQRGIACEWPGCIFRTNGVRGRRSCGGAVKGGREVGFAVQQPESVCSTFCFFGTIDAHVQRSRTCRLSPSKCDSHSGARMVVILLMIVSFRM